MIPLELPRLRNCEAALKKKMELPDLNIRSSRGWTSSFSGWWGSNCRRGCRAARWRWAVALVSNQSVNAFSMPGGGLVVYTGVLVKLQPTDDELAALLATLVAQVLLDQQREVAVRQMAFVAAAQAVGAPATGPDASLPASMSQFAIAPIRRRQVLQADALAAQLLGKLGIPVSAQISLIEKTMANFAPQADGPFNTFPDLAERLAPLRTGMAR
ncbi:M48 family metalloprotease [Polaromonas sp. P2-4]|nr:M48 family metalloprotease [Polaromonas sp. P2-4]